MTELPHDQPPRPSSTHSLNARSALVLGTIWLTVGVVLATVACGNADADTNEEIAMGSDSPMVDWGAFRASVKVIPGAGFVVDRDVLYNNEQALYDYWQRELASARGQALTVDTELVNGVRRDAIWLSPQGLSLTYCVGSGFTSAQLNQLLPALDAAARLWSEIAAVRHVRKTISGTCDLNNTSVVFDVQRSNFGTGVQAAGFYAADPRTERTLFVDDSAFTYTEHGETLTKIMAHEFGHTLGFFHEHAWGGLGGCPDPVGDGRLVTGPEGQEPANADWHSIMFYAHCRDFVPSSILSDLDRYGVALLYGLAPASNAAVSTPIIDL